VLTADHGFTDLWLQQSGRAGPGNTAALGELVTDNAADFDRRIDLVLAKPTPPVRLVVSRAEVTGNEPRDRDPVTKLWPSDHAGVVVQLQVG
jgi:hypothetical protein